MEIDGVALVVGAGSGIGREVAKALTLRGASTLICADIDLESAEETADLCKNLQPGHITALALQADVRDEDAVQRMVNESVAKCGRIDYFVSTAGFGAANQKPISSMTVEEYRSMDEVHNIGVFLCLRTVLKVMLQQEPKVVPVSGRPTSTAPRHMSKGSIVILTSLASEGSFLGVGNYTAPKHAVKGLVQTTGKPVPLPSFSELGANGSLQALENARNNIRINAVAPSYVSGPMMNKFLEEAPSLKATILGDLAMGRLVDPEEVADAVAFLASASASYVNGHTLVVDGGASLQLANTPFSG